MSGLEQRIEALERQVEHVLEELRNRDTETRQLRQRLQELGRYVADLQGEVGL